jgi:5-hydroxyisourate hydrolase
MPEPTRTPYRSAADSGTRAAAISTHVLDTERGAPASGVRVDLFRGATLVSSAETDHDGRVARLADPPLRRGTYRLVFHVGGPFVSRLEVAFAVADPDRHYHIPLLVSPYACTVYRGS